MKVIRERNGRFEAAVGPVGEVEVGRVAVELVEAGVRVFQADAVPGFLTLSSQAWAIVQPRVTVAGERSPAYDMAPR